MEQPDNIIIEFIKLEEHHIPILLEIRNECREFLHDDSEFTMEQATNWYRNTSPLFFIIMMNNVPIGYFRTSNWNQTERSVYIGCDIDKKYRGLQLGYKSYIKFIEKIFAEYDLDKIMLEVLSTNTRAFNLYKKLNFIVTGKIENVIERDNKKIDSIIMTLYKTIKNKMIIDTIKNLQLDSNSIVFEIGSHMGIDIEEFGNSAAIHRLEPDSDMTLDNYCGINSIHKIDLILLNVESTEHLVLSGAQYILEKTKCIYTKYSNSELHNGQLSMDQIIDFNLPGKWSTAMCDGGGIILKNENLNDTRAHDIIKNLQLNENSSVFIFGNSEGRDKNIFDLLNNVEIHSLSTDRLINYRSDVETINLMIVYPDYGLDIVNALNLHFINNTEFVYINYSNREMFYNEESMQQVIDLLPGNWTYSKFSNDTILIKNQSYRDSLINSHGYWDIKDLNEHYFDEPLAKEIGALIKESNLINAVDFGCGPGEYVKYLKANKIDIIGFDGNKKTPEITNGLCSVRDLAVPFYLGNKFDLVISLEVGEHIPEEFETIFIENLINHCNVYLILSWGIPGQGGYGHVNCKTNEYIKNKICSYGFTCEEGIEDNIRNAAAASWFKNTLMIFKNNN